MLKKFALTVAAPQYKQALIDEFVSAGFEIENEKQDSLYNFNVMLPAEMEPVIQADYRISAYRIGGKEENGISIESQFLVSGLYQISQSDTASDGGAINSSWSNWGVPAVSLSSDPFSDATPKDVSFNRLLTGKGVDIVIADSVYRSHPEFLDDNGASRVVELNWPEVSGTTAIYPEWNMADFYDQAYPAATPHGTAIASLAAGRKFGLAKDALIYPCRTGQSTNPFGMTNVVNIVRLWHLNKRAAGNMRPTVLNFSAISQWNDPAFGFVMYRGARQEVSSSSTLAQKAAVKVTNQFSTNGKFPAPWPQFKADCKAAVDAGVIIVVSAGNSGSYMDSVNGLDWNNTLDGNRQYNQGGNPGEDVGVVNVGNINSKHTSGKLTICKNSVRGPGVTIYAPGENTIAASTSGNGAPLPYATQYPGSTNANHLMGRSGGTSSSAPMVAGMLATFAEANPMLDGYGAIALLKEFQGQNHVYTPAEDLLNGESLWGDSSRFALTPYTSNKKTGIF